jgi:hypothetical protein
MIAWGFPLRKTEHFWLHPYSGYIWRLIHANHFTTQLQIRSVYTSCTINHYSGRALFHTQLSPNPQISELETFSSSNMAFKIYKPTFVISNWRWIFYKYPFHFSSDMLQPLKYTDGTIALNMEKWDLEKLRKGFLK